MNPLRGREGVPTSLARKASRRVLIMVAGGFGGAVLIPVVIVVLVVAVASSPINQLGHWLGDLFGGGSAMVCPATGPSVPVKLTPAITSRLVHDQQIFVAELASKTHLDVTVLAAWMLNEESGGAAAARQAAHNNDWLNIGYTDSGQIATGDSVWSSPISAAIATYGWMDEKEGAVPGDGVASPGIHAILATAGQSPSAQINAIRTSGWASSTETLLEILYAQLASAPGTPTTASVLGEAPTSSPDYAAYEQYLNSVCSTAGSSTLQLTKGEQATLLPDGDATAPADAPKQVKLAIAAANAIDHKPYLASHPTSLTYMWPYYDCSGSTSEVLYKAGLHSSTPEVSGTLENWGVPGPGKWITIYANSGHVFMQIAGLAFNTEWAYDHSQVMPSSPSSGPRWQPYYTIAAQIAGTSYGPMAVRHWPGL